MGQLEKKIPTKIVEVPKQYLLIGDVTDVNEQVGTRYLQGDKAIRGKGIILGGYALEIKDNGAGFKFGCKHFTWAEFDIVKAFLAGKKLPLRKVLFSKSGSNQDVEVVAEVGDWLLYRDFNGTGTPSAVDKKDYEVREVPAPPPHGLQISGQSLRTGDGSTIGDLATVNAVIAVLDQIRDFLEIKK